MVVVVVVVVVVKTAATPQKNKVERGEPVQNRTMKG